MKKIIVLIASIMLVTFALCGCGKKENPDVTALKDELTQFAVDHASDYFDAAIDVNKFDITIGSNDKDTFSKDTLTPLTSTDIDQTIYLTGRFKGEPETVESFIVVYDPVSKKITQYGMQKMGDDDVKYIDVK